VPTVIETGLGTTCGDAAEAHDDEVDEEEMATTYPMTVRRRR